MVTKRLTLLALAIILALALAACKAQSDAMPTVGGTTEPPVEAVETAILPETATVEPTTETVEPTAETVAPSTEVATETTTEATAEVTTEPGTEATTAPAPLPGTTPVFIEATGGTADSLTQAWQQAYTLPPGMPFSLTATEAELEARIAQAMTASGYGQNVSDYDVSLNNGQIGLSFALTIQALGGGGTNGTMMMIFTVTVDGNGDLAVNMVSAEFTAGTGVLIIPPEILLAFNTAVNMAVSGADVAAQYNVNVTFTAVVISGGRITISGYVTPG